MTATDALGTDLDDLFLVCGVPADEFLATIASAAAHVADAFEAVTGPTSAASFERLYRDVAALPVCPEEPVGLEQVMAEVRARVLDEATAVSHPGYLAHLHCPPLLPALAAEVMISATNQSLDSFDQSPSGTALECHVVDWMLDITGFGAGGDGVFTSGATQSNLMGLLLARDAHAQAAMNWSISRHGLPPEAARWRVACSPLAHFSVAQSLSLLGLGERAILEIPCGPDGRMLPDALRAGVEASLRRHERPIAVVATAGTTDLGSIDPLTDIAAVAREHGLWVHADAAAGGALLFSDRHRHLVEGLRLVDSLAIDFHKLLFQPISCGIFLVRDKASFELMRRHADYLNPADDERDGTVHLVRKSLQTTRRFDALKVFMTMRALGRRTIARLVDATIDAARAAAEYAAAQPNLRLISPAATNTVVLRWAGPAATPPDLAESVNAGIHRALCAQGQALVGRTRHSNATVLKLTFVNPLCGADHARRLVADIAARGDQLAARLGANGRTSDI